MLKLNGALRFDSPGGIPSGVVRDLSDLAGRIPDIGKHCRCHPFVEALADLIGPAVLLIACFRQAVRPLRHLIRRYGTNVVGDVDVYKENHGK